MSADASITALKAGAVCTQTLSHLVKPLEHLAAAVGAFNAANTALPPG